MAIAAKEVSELRKMTGAGMMDCKKALVEAEGDCDKAIELLRKKGQKVSASRSDRATTEGVVAAKTNDDQTEGTLIALTCETDFVAKNEDFATLAKEVLEAAYSSRAADIDAIKALPAGGGITLGDKIVENIGKMGEKIEITAYERLTAEQVVTYIHAGSKLGVLVGLSNTKGTDQTEAGKDAAMQIAAMNPLALDKDGIDASIVEREIEIAKAQARAEGKPEQMAERIVTGKLDKFYRENTLLRQAFVRDSSVNISQYLDRVSRGMTVSAFKRVAIG